MFGQTSGVSSPHQHEEKVHISIHVSTNILRGVSIMFGRTSGVSSPHQHEEKTFISVNVCLQIFGFRCTTPTSARPQLFSFLSVGHVKILVFFQLQLNVKKHFTIALFMPVRSFTTLPVSSKGCDTLGICCEL